MRVPRAELQVARERLRKVKAIEDMEARAAAARAQAAAETCAICMNAPRTHAFVPCGHRSLCGDCAVHFDAFPSHEQVCLVCRTPARGALRIYDV